ncbi:hypothetical protein ACJMK2_026794 [Sinanodonta woodiana]|uniref:Uncharacterized protein n=1 Tax=Sinanodonta woodiana TaxID=1069815 RepID=A0ABD3XKW6_SINWO
MKTCMVIMICIVCFISVASASSEMVKDGWQCIKQCLWAILKVYLENGIMDAIGTVAQIAWDFFYGPSNGNDWFLLQKAKDYLPYLVSMLERYNYIKDAYEVWIKCTECL